MSRFGLEHEYLEMLVNAARVLPDIERVYLFGSRATGKFRRNSDVDIALEGGNLGEFTPMYYADILNQALPFPYRVDALDLNRIHEELFMKAVRSQLVLLHDFTKEKHNSAA